MNDNVDIKETLSRVSHQQAMGLSPRITLFQYADSYTTFLRLARTEFNEQKEQEQISVSPVLDIASFANHMNTPFVLVRNAVRRAPRYTEEGDF